MRNSTVEQIDVILLCTSIKFLGKVYLISTDSFRGQVLMKKTHFINENVKIASEIFEGQIGD